MEEAEAVVFGSNTLVGKVERELTIRSRRQARDRGLPVLFDPNLRPSRWEEMDTAVFTRGLRRRLPRPLHP